MIEMSEQRFEELVGDALDAVPEQLMRLTDNVVVLVQDRYEGPEELLGLYEGVALTRRGHDYSGGLPDRILIFRDTILSVCGSPAQVIDEVRVTMVHEIAHHFGIDDARLHDLGWA